MTFGWRGAVKTVLDFEKETVHPKLKWSKYTDKGAKKLGRYLGFGFVIMGFLSTEALAGCPQGQEAFTSCQIEGRSTEVFVCFDDRVATYSYGSIGEAPDLFLSETITHVDFEPWSGLGKAIHENVTFYNGDYSFEVGGGFERPFSEEEMLLGGRHFGWLEVAQNGESVSRLECIPETVTYGFGGGIYDAKMAVGLVWDDYSKTWIPDPHRPTAPPMHPPILMENTHLGITEDCLPSDEFKLDGIMLGYLLADLGKLLPPMTGEVITGGPFEIERFMYDGLRFDTLKGAIIEMEVTIPDWEMPSGIRVGLTRGEVIAILGRVPNGGEATAQRFDALSCLGDQSLSPEWYVVINFGQDKRVQNISFASLSP